MSQSVLDAIDAEIATLATTTLAPTGDLLYGRDLSCAIDLSPDLREVDPGSPVGIGESVIRRLTCPRGRLPDDPSYGLDVRAFCNRATPTAELRDLAGIIRNEVLKDDRIDEATVDVTFPAPRSLRVAIVIQPVASALGPFSLIFAIVDGQVAVEAMR